jgi:hypothetical protein
MGAGNMTRIPSIRSKAFDATQALGGRHDWSFKAERKGSTTSRELKPAVAFRRDLKNVPSRGVC